MKKKYLKHLLYALPLLLALCCIVSVSVGTHQASMPIPMPQEFLGEYSYDEETWMPLEADTELSAREGDLFLRGHFLRELYEGSHLSFYRNHIGVSLFVNGEQIYLSDISDGRPLDTRLFASMCAREWMDISCPQITTEDLVEIHLHNPHRYGNEDAYREFLTTLCADAPEWNLLESNLQPYSRPFRFMGGLLAITFLMLLGAAVAAVTLRIPMGETLLKLGLMNLFAGGFIVFEALDISFWNELNVLNTYGGQICMMLAVFCFDEYIAGKFTGANRRPAVWAIHLSGIFNSILILLSCTDAMVIFDTLPYWVLSQLVLCPFLIGCSIYELRCGTGSRLIPVAGILMLSAVLLDTMGVGDTIIWRSPFSTIVFSVLYCICIISGAKNALENHRASIRAEKLEKELEESRITIMLSQIKPHFLYNVLNAIYHLYRKEPETAQEAVSSFAEYLRCNMLSIEKREPIPFREEYQHIQTYLSLEQIRFRGKLDVVYDVEVVDFKLPPLTVEPLVENAVKHGVTKKRGGGTVTISTRKTQDHYVISVSDTGVGFDPERYAEDGKPHVGIRNVRERLQSMMGGTLSITSSPEGTIAVVTIPAKEE